MLKKHVKLLPIYLGLLATLPSSAADNEWVLITANDNAPNSLSKARVIALFSSSKVRWEGAALEPIITSDNNQLKEFCEYSLGINEITLKRSWQRRVFMGTGFSPIEANSLENAIQLLQENKNGISYARKSDLETIENNLHIIEVEEK